MLLKIAETRLHIVSVKKGRIVTKTTYQAATAHSPDGWNGTKRQPPPLTSPA